MPCTFVAALIMIYALWPEPQVAMAPPLPSPNGYDDFMKAGAMLAALSYDYSKMPVEELKACLSTNQEPLRLVRLGLTRECQVPTEDSADYIRGHLPDLMNIKLVAQLISAEGKLAEMEGRFADAARSHLDNVRYGPASANGGLIIDKLVGIAVEIHIGIVGLENVADKLDAREIREIIGTLEESDARSTPASVFLARDRQWSRKAERWMEKLQAMWAAKTFFYAKQSEQRFSARIQNSDLRRRQLLLNLAARAYELEHGKKPVRAEDLVPSVLRTLPKDPETGTNLVLNPVP